MSIWYQLNVTCIAKNRAAVAKFFGLRDSHEDIRTDMFEFSFGGKNGPSLRLASIVEQNPDIIFLVKEQIECDTVHYFLIRAGKEPNNQQFINIQDSGHVNYCVNKKLLNVYQKAMPELTKKHIENMESFRWIYILSDFEKSATMLDQADQYEEMFIVSTKADIDFDFDNQPLE